MQNGSRTLFSISPYAILAILLLLFNAGFLWYNFKTVRNHQVSIERTTEVQHRVDLLSLRVKDAEAGARGYALTKDPSFLRAYQAGKSEIWRHFKSLKDRVQENPIQSASLVSLEAAINTRLEAFENLVDEVTSRPRVTAIDPSFVRAGQAAGDVLRTQTDLIRDEELRNLAERGAKVQSSQRNFAISLWGTTLLSIFVIGWSLSKVWQNQRRAESEAERQAVESNRKAKVVELSQMLSGPLSLEEVGREVLKFLSKNMQFFAGNFYILQDKQLQRVGAFAEAGDASEACPRTIQIEEGLIGEAALRTELWEITQVPESYFWLSSSLGRGSASVLTFIPIRHEEQNIGILELASFVGLKEEEKNILNAILGVIADGLNAAHWRTQIQNLLLKTQQQSEELQTQQEELRASNEELEQQTEELKNQQDELRATNDALEDQARVLEKQKESLNQQKQVLEARTKELTRANQYKSEFLARMSHELRTPLNSLLILATLLIENKEKNLTGRQLEFAQSIYSAGHDLLGLINDILDLSKIDAKKLVLRPEKFKVESLFDHLKKTFDIQFQGKNIEFRISKDSEIMGYEMWSDRQRIEQVLRNFLSNSLKFTESGHVELKAKSATKAGWVRFEVIDTGIGIPNEKKELIFEAFEQADSSVSRKYGGTGLGLSISRELTNLLGGIIQVESELGKGSCFAVELPLKLSTENKVIEEPLQKQAAEPVTPLVAAPPPPPSTDRQKTVKKLLVVEDNERQREAIIQLVSGPDIEVSTAKTGEDAFQSIQKIEFDCVILDLELPDITGFEVLQRLKALSIEAPPVVIYTGREITEREEEKLRRFSESIIIKGARSPERLVEEVNTFLKRHEETSKPEGLEDLRFQDKSLQGKTVLLVDDDLRNVFSLANGLESWGLNVRIARNGLEGLELLEESPEVDIVLMDMMMPKMDGYEAIERIRERKQYDKLPVIALTAKTAKESREKAIHAGANDYLPKPIPLSNLRSVLKTWLVSQRELT